MKRRAYVRHALALGWAVISFVAVMAGQRQQGVVRDEVVYMTYGNKYAAWWSDLVSGTPQVLTREAITRHFGGPRATDNNREHPPLLKTLSGLSVRWFHDRLGWSDRISAYRIPSAAFHAALIALVFWFASGFCGLGAGIIAAALVFGLPRGLFHAGLACFDAAVVTTWFATLFAYDRALRSRWWCLGLGLCFGLALATKHNALMLPAVLGLHYLWVSWRCGRAAAVAHGASGESPPRGVRGARVGAGLRMLGRGMWRTQPLMFPALFLVGPLVLLALWPWLWFDTVDHVLAWIRFHLHHVHYNYEYLGRNWNAPPYPWHVPVVTTLFTVPVVTSLAAAVGAGVLLQQWRRGSGDAYGVPRSRRHGDQDDAGVDAPDHGARVRDEKTAAVGTSMTSPMLLLALSAGVAMGPFLLGWAPIFGAEKHWAPAIPTICIWAAIGVIAAARMAVQAFVNPGDRESARLHWAHRASAILLGTAVVAAALMETKAAHPYALSHYNALAGGAPGAADLGMNRQFWGYAARGVLPFVNQHAPAAGQPAKRVYSHDASPAWSVYRDQGLLAPGLPDAGRERAGIARSALALVIHELHFLRHDYIVWDEYGTVQPAYVLTFQGVPIVSVYVRP